MSKRATPKQVNRRYHSSMKNLTKGAYEQEILASLTNGKNTYMRVDRQESSSFDNSWIETIEGVIFDLGEIVQNPRMNTRTDGAIVPVELARKTNAESVQHLASHTQFVKEIDEFGNVIPSKILTILHDDEIRTYENRFIATFIRRLVLFVEKRYEVVAKMAQLNDEEVLMVKNKSNIDGCEVEVETKVRIVHPRSDAQAIQSNSYIQRIEQMRNYILYFYNSDFMKKLKTEKDVHNPILQTNIIRKNLKYHHCYEVYKFIESYSSLGVNYRVNESYSLFNEEEMEELNRTLFANYITLKGKDRSKETKGTTKVYKPRVITSPDDEEFVYGKHLAGPFEFVRTDALYREYLASKVRDDLPLHPTKKEKEYYADEYAAKDELRQDDKQLNDLLNRINKEATEFQKEIERVEIEREQHRLELERRQAEVIDQEEEGMLEEAREEIVKAALEDEETRLAREREEYKKFLATIKEAEEPVPMSHPYSRAVTFEQACIDIWPFLSYPQERHIYHEEPLTRLPEPAPQPIRLEEPAAVNKPAPVCQEPVTFDEAVKQIWPQIRSVHHNFNNYEEPSNLPPMEQQAPQQAAINELAPVYQEPVTYEQAVKQIWPQIKDVAHEYNKQEPLERLPEEQPIPTPVPVPIPVSAEEGPAETAPVAPAPKTKIPGKFIVSTPDGYYVSNSKRSGSMNDAKVFDDYRYAAGIAKAKDGKVVMLSDAPRPARKAPVVPPVAPKENTQPAPKTKIPGRYVVFTKEGYYISKSKRVTHIKEAKVFDDYRYATGIAKSIGGKVVKL